MGLTQQRWLPNKKARLYKTSLIHKISNLKERYTVTRYGYRFFWLFCILYYGLTHKKTNSSKSSNDNKVNSVSLFHHNVMKRYTGAVQDAPIHTVQKILSDSTFHTPVENNSTVHVVLQAKGEWVVKVSHPWKILVDMNNSINLSERLPRLLQLICSEMKCI